MHTCVFRYRRQTVNCSIKMFADAHLLSGSEQAQDACWRPPLKWIQTGAGKCVLTPTSWVDPAKCSKNKLMSTARMDPARHTKKQKKACETINRPQTASSPRTPQPYIKGNTWPNNSKLKLIKKCSAHRQVSTESRRTHQTTFSNLSYVWFIKSHFWRMFFLVFHIRT